MAMDNVIVVLGVIAVFFAAILYFQGPSTSWKRFRSRGTVTELEFDEDGWIMRRPSAPVSEVRGDWAYFKAVLERRGLILLIPASGKSCVVVPRRAFASSEDEARFRGWCDEKVITGASGTSWRVPGLIVILSIAALGLLVALALVNP